MRVISRSRLKMFWEHPNNGPSKGPLSAWYTHVSCTSVDWENWGNVRAFYGNADAVGNCVIFNIGGNKYRLITRIMYESRRVYILKVMTHQEYDLEKWKDECGCFTEAPKKSDGRSAATKKAAKKVRTKKSAKRRR